MSDSESVAQRFYSAFQRHDGKSMGDLYADSSTFSDPVFPLLRAREVRAMWAMLTERAKDLSLTFSIEEESSTEARTTWHANYTFSKTGRKVENHITATMETENGLIVRHVDDFSFWRWSSQALGVPGLLLGWTPLLRAKIRTGAQESLRSYMEQ